MEKNYFNHLIKMKDGYCIYNKNDIYIGKSIETYGEFSSLEGEFFEEFCTKGDFVIEVGSNIGVHTLTLSGLVGKKGVVVAYEPQRLAFQTLCGNMALNSITNVYTYNQAVSNKSGKLMVPELDYTKQNNFGGISLGNTKEGSLITTITLDQLQNSFPKLQFLKIDVEGMEVEVLQGGKNFIEKFSPAIYIENDRQERSQELIELLWSYGYTLYWHLPPLFNQNNFFKVEKNIFDNLVSVNMICVKSELPFPLDKYDLKKIEDSNFHPMKKGDDPQKKRDELTKISQIAYQKKEYQKAVNCLTKIINEGAANSQTYHNLANLLKQLNQPKEALKVYLQSLKKFPKDPNIHNSIGIIFETLGETNKAIDAYKNAIKLNPKFSKAVNNLGVVLYKQKRYDESAAIFQLALDIDPEYIEVYSNMGAALNKAKKYDQSIKALETAIEKMPDHGGAYTNLGNVYNKLYEYKKAVKYHEKSIELEPNGANAYSNLGTSYKNLGYTKKAIQSYKKAIKLDPNFENAHFDLSTVYLSVGDFENGLREYEWRFQKEEMKGHMAKYNHIFSKPMMKKGEDIKNKTILIHSEQGFGDSIMYARFLPKLKKLGCKIVVECRDELKTLFETISCIEVVVGREEEKTPSFDLHIPIMSLAYLLDVKSFEDFPTPPYFEVSKDPLFDLSDQKRLKIGLCWSASATGESYDGKVFELDNFEPLIKNSKIQIYSLQVGHGSEQIKKYGYEKDIIDLTDNLTDFSKTASFLQELDLVISSDTSVAHLAGSIGVKTYTLLQKYPDWRWLNKGEDSYMYPSMKLFRQKQNRNWRSVFQSLFDKMDKEYKLKLKI